MILPPPPPPINMTSTIQSLFGDKWEKRERENKMRILYLKLTDQTSRHQNVNLCCQKTKIIWSFWFCLTSCGAHSIAFNDTLVTFCFYGNFQLPWCWETVILSFEIELDGWSLKFWDLPCGLFVCKLIFTKPLFLESQKRQVVNLKWQITRLTALIRATFEIISQFCQIAFCKTKKSLQLKYHGLYGVVHL